MNHHRISRNFASPAPVAPPCSTPPPDPPLVTHARRMPQSFQTLMLLKIACPCLAGIAVALLTGCANKDQVVAAGPPVSPVTVATVVQRSAPIDVQVIGNVEAYETVSVKSQIGGILDTVSIREGEFVNKGDLLFTIDPRPLQAQVNQVLANLAHDNAALRQAEANLRRDISQESFARTQAQRYAQLFERKA